MELRIGIQAFPPEQLVLIVEGAKAVLVADVRRDKTKFDWSLKIDVTAKPWSIDLTALQGDSKGKTFHCSFAVDGDQFRICGENEPGKKRPKTFDIAGLSNHVLARLKRRK